MRQPIGIEPIINIDLNAVRLQQAVLCANCDVISDSPHDHCLVCGSRSLLPLARVLGAVPRPALPASPLKAEKKADTVLVLASPLPHRRRQRALR